MKRVFQTFTYIFVLITGGAILSSFYYQQLDYSGSRFPYNKAGLTQKEATAHLLSRFSFGVKPGDIGAVSQMGLEAWFDQQLQSNLEDNWVDSALVVDESLKMSNEEI